MLQNPELFFLRDSLPTTIRDLQAIFELAVDTHQTPFILPVPIALVELLLPGLIESLEPTPFRQHRHPTMRGGKKQIRRTRNSPSR